MQRSSQAKALPPERYNTRSSGRSCERYAACQSLRMARSAIMAAPHGGLSSAFTAPDAGRWTGGMPAGWLRPRPGRTIRPRRPRGAGRSRPRPVLFGFGRHRTDSVTAAAVFASCPWYKGRPVTFTVQWCATFPTRPTNGRRRRQALRGGGPTRSPVLRRRRRANGRPCCGDRSRNTPILPRLGGSPSGAVGGISSSSRPRRRGRPRMARSSTMAIRPVGFRGRC